MVSDPMQARLAVSHRHPEHTPDEDPCSCGRSAVRHRKRSRKGRKQAFRPYVSKNDAPVIGLDGEGQGRDPHLYTYLAAVDEYNHTIGEVFNPRGLTTYECLDFLLDSGVDRMFGYSLGYDLTKWLWQLPDITLYYLNRPELRRRKSRRTGKVSPVPSPVYWKQYKINYVQRRFTVQRVLWSGKRSIPVGPSVTVWDVFGFYQGKFTKALTDWQIATVDKLARMIRMKDTRANHDKQSQHDIQEYCREECFYLAKLVRALIDTHEDCGLPLRAFRGAGSTAAVLLRQYQIKTFIAAPPLEAREAVAAAFAGGRFERSWIGPVRGKVYNRDIASAYPYQIARLPCLIHGRWTHVKRDRTSHAQIERARLALVHATVHPSRSGPRAFGPFPFRAPDGTITFPLAMGGAWVWKDEYLAGRRLWPGVEHSEAWLYHTDCDCKPFGKLPELYRERLKMGKEARGIVPKLGMNSIYGKLAQSVGSPPYQCWVWAGCITSDTRAMLLEALARASDPWSILMFATDGIFSTEDLDLPKPVDTGTFDTGKPLGGWEAKPLERGIFILQPGIYFPLDPSEDEQKEIRARGMAKDVLLKNAARIQEYWELYQKGASITCDEPECKSRDVHFHIKGLQRFVGMKSSVLKGTVRTGGPRRTDLYGEWTDYPIEVSFDPEPKRPGRLNGWKGTQRLQAWEYKAGESMTYRKATRSPEAEALKALETIMAEQPGGDFCD